jgi:hypothetical protein
MSDSSPVAKKARVLVLFDIDGTLTAPRKVQWVGSIAVPRLQLRAFLCHVTADRGTTRHRVSGGLARPRAYRRCRWLGLGQSKGAVGRGLWVTYGRIVVAWLCVHCSLARFSADLSRFDYAFPENGLTAYYMATPIGVTVGA